MKKLLLFLLVATLIVSAVPIGAFTLTVAAETDGYYTYTVSNGKATLDSVDSSITGDVTIPSTLGGYPVTSIGDYAFYARYGVTNITIPNGVVSIGKGAFAYCFKLKSIIIPESVTSIGERAFEASTPLTNIYIPKNVETIGDKAFTATYSLNKIEVDENNKYYASKDGVLFNRDFTQIIWYPSNKQDESYDIPDSITSIGEDPFYDCHHLKNLAIPYSVTTIEQGAFDGCFDLENINVDENNKNYSSINGVLFNKDTTVLIRYPINKTNSSYTVLDSVISIDVGAFSSCEYLTSVSIGNSVTKIMGGAFAWCKNLTSIIIPENVTNIVDDSVFRGSNNVTIYGLLGTYAETYANEYNIPFEIKKAYEPGDINDDGKINNRDYALLMQFINKWDVTIIEDAADVNADGKINNRDYALLMQYINKWDVELQ